MKYTTDDGHGAKDADGNVPGDNLAYYHEQAAEKQQDGRNLAKRTAMLADNHLYGRGHILEHAGIARLYGPLHEGERRGAGLCIEILHTAANGPCGHLCREGDEQEHTSHKGGIEGVLTQSAKGHLAYAYCHQGADDDNPQGQVGGEVETQQDTREDGRAVHYGCTGTTQNELCYRPFKNHT